MESEMTYAYTYLLTQNSREGEMKKFLISWFWNVLIGFDQFVNAILFGDPDETISARMGRWCLNAYGSNCKTCWAIAKVVCWFLDFFDKGHCMSSIEKDEGRGDLME